MKYGVLVVACLLGAACGLDIFGNSPGSASPGSAPSPAQALTGRAEQEKDRQDQNQQRQKQNQQENSQSQTEYIKEYVPKEYQSFALKDQKQEDESSKHVDNHQSDKGSAADSTVNLLQLLPQSSPQMPQSSGTKNHGHYEHYIKQYTEGSSGYQKYMKKYADKYSGGSSNYSQYMSNYAGDYNKYANYQEYIQRYSRGKNSGKDVVREAREADNITMLNKWRNYENQNVQWYVPTEYGKYANRHIEEQYNKRLHQLQGKSTSDTLSLSNPIPSILDLDALPQGMDHLNATQRKAYEIKHFKQASQAGLDKAEHLSASLKRAAADTKSIEMMAAKPANNVATAFTDRAKAMENKLVQLQQQVKSKQADADFASKVKQTVGEVKKLHNDEFDALRKATHDATRATRHAARGSENEVREEARRVWATSDQLERKDESYQDMTNRFQNRVEAAADDVESHSEQLARRTEDRLQEHLSRAKEEVRRVTDRRLDTLREVEGQFEQQAARSQTFLAQYADETKSSLAPLAPLGLVIGAFVTMGLGLMVFAMRNRRQIKIPQNTLG